MTATNKQHRSPTASTSKFTSRSSSYSSRPSISSNTDTDSTLNVPAMPRIMNPIQQQQSTSSPSSSTSDSSTASEPLPSETVHDVTTADKAIREYEDNNIKPLNRPIQYDNGLYCYPTDTHRRQQYLDYLNQLPVSYFSHVPQFVWCGVREAPNPATICDLLDPKKGEKSLTPITQAPRISRCKKQKRY